MTRQLVLMRLNQEKVDPHLLVFTTRNLIEKIDRILDSHKRETPQWLDDLTDSENGRCPQDLEVVFDDRSKMVIYKIGTEQQVRTTKKVKFRGDRTKC